MIKDNLDKGSFRGVEFNFRSLGTSGGRKTIIHTFPNSDGALFEDLGELPESFRLEIYISGIGEEYYSRRDALTTAFKKEGSGVLVHPTNGTIDVQINGAYELTENIGSMGRATFTVSFTKVKNIQEKATFDFFGDVSSSDPRASMFLKTDEAIGLLGDVFENEILIEFIKASAAVSANTTGLGLALNVLSVVMQGTEFYSQFKKTVAVLDLLSPTQVPEILATVNEAFSQAEQFIESPSDRYAFFKPFFNYNDDIDPRRTTKELDQTHRNNVLFRDLIQVSSVGYAANASADIDYSTIDEIDTVSTELFAQFDKVLETQGTNTEVYNTIQSLKVATNSQLETARINAFRIITVESKGSSLSTLVYDYYGNQDNYDLIKSLNNFTDFSDINGSVLMVANG